MADMHSSPLAAMILAKVNKDPGQEPEEAPDSEPSDDQGGGMMDAMSKLFPNMDPMEAADAFKAAFQSMESEPHDEGSAPTEE